MLLTPHVIIGIAIASVINSPWVAIPAALASHFLADLVPHWDFYFNTTKIEKASGWRTLAVMGDLAIGVGVGMLFTLYALWQLDNPGLSLNIFLCGITAVLPDALTGPYIYKTNGTNIISDFVHKIQSKCQFSVPLPWGAITQVVVVLFCLLVITSSLA
jgi:hypothetical protein